MIKELNKLIPEEHFFIEALDLKNTDKFNSKTGEIEKIEPQW